MGALPPTSVERNVAHTGGPNLRVAPGIGVPGKTPSGNVANVSFEPEVYGGGIDPVESRKDRGRLPEPGALEVDILARLGWRTLPRTNVHGICRAAVDVILILRISNPVCGGGPQRRVRPSVDVDGEAPSVYVGGVGPDASAGTRACVDMPQPYDDNWRVMKGRSKLMRREVSSLG